METKYRRVVEPWIQYSPTPEGDRVCNIYRKVRYRNPLWEVRTWGTDTASWAMIWTDGHNEPNSPAGLISLSLSWLRFVSRILELMAKHTPRVVDTLIVYAPSFYGNVWVWQRRWAQNWLMQSMIRWGGGDRHMVDQLKEHGFEG